MKQRFEAIQDRIHEIDRKTKIENLSKEDKIKLLNEAVECAVSIGDIALEKMKRGDTT